MKYELFYSTVYLSICEYHSVIFDLEVHIPFVQPPGCHWSCGDQASKATADNCCIWCEDFALFVTPGWLWCEYHCIKLSVYWLSLFNTLTFVVLKILKNPQESSRILKASQLQHACHSTPFLQYASYWLATEIEAPYPLPRFLGDACAGALTEPAVRVCMNYFYIILYYIISYHIILYYIISYYIILYYIILYYILV